MPATSSYNQKFRNFEMPQAFDSAANIFKNTSKNLLFLTEKCLPGWQRGERAPWAKLLVCEKQGR
jgi:hypothetical protein